MQTTNTTCCVAGGGPAGLMLGYLLARAGIEVVVLEKHADFLRDFRGDTIHPSTLELMHELGLLEKFLALPHQEYQTLQLLFEDRIIQGPDFKRLPTVCKFLAFMPQWDFLNFLAEQGRALPKFRLLMRAEVQDIIEENGIVTGVRAQTPEGQLEVRAEITFGADGRGSCVRAKAGLIPKEFGVPIDVLWFRLSRPPDYGRHALAQIKGGRFAITIDRGDYLQAGYLIPKGTLPQLKQQGLETFQEKISALLPELASIKSDLDSWDKIKLLTVQINRLPVWHRPGLLCIGDAAHAMSPAGGVGINLAIQDAVAAANLLAPRIAGGTYSNADLALVQRRREWPARATQWLQARIHKRLFRSAEQPFAPSWPVRKLLTVFAPVLRRIGARIIGVGFRAEHIEYVSSHHRK